MILTLISLAEFEGVFRGLYFFSRGGASDGPELLDNNKDYHTETCTDIWQIKRKTWINYFRNITNSDSTQVQCTDNFAVNIQSYSVEYIKVMILNQDG